MRKRRLVIRTTNRSGRKAPRRSILEDVLVSAIQMPKTKLPAGTFLVDITWMTDREMRRLNRRYTGRSGTTDVLAFEDGSECESGAIRLGDVLCNLELAALRSRQLGTSTEAEAVLYAVHGVLHLLGFRDDVPEARRQMRMAEKKALEGAGLAVRGEEWEHLPSAEVKACRPQK